MLDKLENIASVLPSWKLFLSRPANKRTDPDIWAGKFFGKEMTAIDALGLENKVKPNSGGGPR